MTGRPSSSRLRLGVLAVLFATAAARVAAAQPMQSSLLSPFAGDGTIRVEPAQADLHARFVLRYTPAPAPPIPEGTVRTSVDRDLSAKGLSGSVGYLCGLAPNPSEANGTVTSTEPVGTFLGAQLRQRF